MEKIFRSIVHCGLLWTHSPGVFRGRRFREGMSPDSVDWLSKNWSVLSSAPWVFLGLAVLAFSVGYVVGAWFKNGEIAILERRVADYESKLKVGSPDEAKTKLDRLDGEVVAFGKILGVTVGKPWLPLMLQEVADLSGKLLSIPKHRVQLMYLNQLGKDLAQTLFDAFTKAGWTGITLSDGGGSPVGIIAGPGAGKAGAIKAAIESSTNLKVSVDKPTQPEAPDFIYLFVGINAP